MVVMLVCIFALTASARTNYREEQTYNYYDTEGNLLYSATTIFAQDSKSGYVGTYRYEVIIRESGEGFAKFDENGTPLTWYVTGTDKLDDIIGGASLEQDGVINITVTSVPTLDSSIATVNSSGRYEYKTDTDGVCFSKKVVSANFFTTGVKSFVESDVQRFKVIQLNGKTNGAADEFCKMTDNGNLLCLYLPETLTSIPDQFCKRSTVRVLEFENNKISTTTFRTTAFQFCANLKSITIPEGILKLEYRTFRECLSLTYVKLANTMERMENDAFHRCSNIETFIMGKNMTFCGFLNNEVERFYLEDTRPTSSNIKYYYMTPTLNSKCDFDSYRGGSGNGAVYYGEYRNVIFFLSGSLAQAEVVATFSGDSFKATLHQDVATKRGWTYNEPISYETYIANKEYYDTQITNHLLVYDVPECVSFYNGHDNATTSTYTDVLTPFVVGNICQRCATMESGTEYAPILSFLGYSAQINGDRICLGYNVNKDSLALFPNMSYGILAAAPSEADMENYEPLNADLTTNGEGKVAFLEIDKKYSIFNFIAKGFAADSSYYDKKLVMCAYVINGDNVDYLCHNELNEVSQQEYASCVTFKFIAEECVPKYTVKFTCDPEMGELTGETNQIVKDGESSTAVTAIAKDGYQFACWSNGSTEATIEYSPSKTTNLQAYFTNESTGLPVISINTADGVAIASKDRYVDCEITLLDTETGKSIGGEAAQIKGRGNSTWDKFDKKPYKFKFESKQNLFGYGKEKTWVLLADARDYSLLRNMLALNAGLTLSELGYTSEGQSVELYLNGEYKGVYYLCEQIQVKENRVNITQEDDEIEQGPADLGYLVEMDAWAADSSNQSGIPNYTADGDVYVTVPDQLNSNRAYTIKDPEDILFDADGNIRTEYLEYIQSYLAQCIAAVQGTDYAAVCELIDVKSFAQTYIIFEWFKNPDVNYSSVYFYKDVDGKLISAPLWDFDMAVGNVTHKANSGTNAQNFRDTTFLWTAAQNPWFKALLKFDDFKALVGQELAANADALRASIANDIAYAKAHGEAYKKNFDVWNLIGNTTAKDNIGGWSVPAEFKAFATWEEHLDYIANYLEESLDYLITYYPAPSAE